MRERWTTTEAKVWQPEVYVGVGSCQRRTQNKPDSKERNRELTTPTVLEFRELFNAK
jgi:hypothetical protein